MYVVAGDGTREPRIIQVDVGSGQVQVVNEVPESPIHPEYISIPKCIRFPTTQGDTTYGHLYLPKVSPGASFCQVNVRKYRLHINTSTGIGFFL